jgi:hypothetical protein
LLIDNILQTDVDDGEEPDDEYNPVQRYHDSINDEDLRCLEHVEEEVHALVAGIISLQYEYLLCVQKSMN